MSNNARAKLLVPVIFSVLLSACATRLTPSAPGPVDPAGNGRGALPASYVDPPYRALDRVNVTGAEPLVGNSARTRAAR